MRGVAVAVIIGLLACSEAGTDEEEVDKALSKLTALGVDTLEKRVSGYRFTSAQEALVPTVAMTYVTPCIACVHRPRWRESSAWWQACC